MKKDKKNYHHGGLKKALIEAGLRILKNEGFRNLSLRKVAAMAEVSVAAPYRHFRNNEELLAEIAAEGFRMLKTDVLMQKAVKNLKVARIKMLMA